MVEVFNFEIPDLYMVSNDNYDEVGIPVLTANKAFILGYKNESGEYKKGDCIIFDDFTLDCKYVSFPFKVNSSAIKILKSNEKYDLKFSYYLLAQADILMQGHARHYISVVQPTEVFVPKKLEQLKISQILGKVDTINTLHQFKLYCFISMNKQFIKNISKLTTLILIV